MDLRPSKMKEVQINGEDICVVNVDGKYYAIGNVCTHEGGPLADGTLSGYEVECPWHGSKFDVNTGEVKKSPASEPEPTYEVKIDDNSILIRKSTIIEQQRGGGGGGEQQQLSTPSRPSSEYELEILEKQKFEGTDVMSFKFSKQLENTDERQQQQEREYDKRTPYLHYTAGQYAFFDIGGVYNDPKGPIRHFTLIISNRGIYNDHYKN